MLINHSLTQQLVIIQFWIQVSFHWMVLADFNIHVEMLQKMYNNNIHYYDYPLLDSVNSPVS